MLFILIPFLLFFIYTLITAFQRVYTFCVSYNYNYDDNICYLGNKDYLKNVKDMLLKTLYIDMHGALFLEKKTRNDLINRESLLSMTKSIVPYIMILGFLFFWAITGFSFQATSDSPNPVLSSLKIILIFYIIYNVLSLLFNWIDFTWYKIRVLMQAIKDFSIDTKTIEKETNTNTPLLPILNKALLQQFGFSNDLFRFAKEIMFKTKNDFNSKYLDSLYDSELQNYATQYNDLSKMNIYQKMWTLLTYLSTGTYGVQTMIFFVIFATVVSNSFFVLKKALPLMEGEDGVDAKKVVLHVIGRLVYLGAGSLLISLISFFVIWCAYIGFRKLTDKGLSNLFESYKSLRDEYDNEGNRVNDFRNNRHLRLLLSLILKRTYPKHVDEAVVFKEGDENSIMIIDYMTLDQSSVQELTNFSAIDLTKQIFLKKITLPTIFSFMIAFFILLSFVFWYESNPHRHQRKTETTQEESERGTFIDGSELTQRTNRYSFLFKYVIYMVGIVVGGMMVLSKIYGDDDPFLKRDTLIMLSKIIILLFIVSGVVFLLFF